MTAHSRCFGRGTDLAKWRGSAYTALHAASHEEKLMSAAMNATAVKDSRRYVQWCSEEGDANDGRFVS